MAQVIGGSVDRREIEGETAAPARRPERFRIPIACAALVAWMLVTTSNPFNVHPSSGLIGALADGPQWGILFAGLFLVGLAAVCRWRDLGISPPVSARSLRLLWLPALYLLIFLVLDIVAGPPPLGVAGFLLLNTALGAFSEEMMFRGVLLGALQTRLPFLAAATISTVLFGLAHLVNAAVIGSFQVAAVQALAAAMSGLVFIAIRVRTGSLVPAIVYHALWDFGMLMAVAKLLGSGGAGAGGGAETAPTGLPTLAMLAVPVVLLLPNFLYALFLLRPGAKRGADAAH